ncbi:hypothetical protein CASFOL_035411 [Castilleja foliolosa]|uniref:FBD domain-containing protein n=1 Tax=Castilleja foliolosa TaxID=1961234 RepID=A0ABD3BTS1_9LAMI
MKKRYKRIKETPMDRLSALPDCLIIHILSFLEVKQSAITALLSKRFQFLWTQSPRLIFSEKRFRLQPRSRLQPREVQDFVNRVNRTLVIYGQNDLDTFEVEFPYSKSYSPDLDVWGGFAVKNKAKQVSLLLNHFLDGEEDNMYTLPRTMFRSAHLNRLTLRADFGSPYLHTLSVTLYPKERKLCLENTPSLVRATLDFVIVDWEFNEELISNAKDLLYNIRHVKVVDLRYSYMQVLTSVAINDYQFPQSARTCLTVEVPLEEPSIHVLVGLLESSPKLESLVIEGTHTYLPCACLDSKTDLDCDLLHLKSVVIKDFTGPDVVCEQMLMMAKILLNKAPTLEKMVFFHNKSFTSSSQPAVNESSFKIAQALLSYPRSSKAVILLK